jgi:hypothetical protein
MTPAQNTTAYIQGFEDGERFTKAKILQEMESDKREWVGLTDDDDIDWEEGGNLRDLVKAIEAKLKEKNT